MSMEALELRVANLEAEKRQVEENMIKAAQFGKELLDKNTELETKLEILEQEKHETHKKFKVSRT